MQIKTVATADQMKDARWRKSRVSNPTGSCVEVAELREGQIAVKNSGDLSGPVLGNT